MGKMGTDKDGEELKAARTVGQSADRFSFPLSYQDECHIDTQFSYEGHISDIAELS